MRPGPVSRLGGFIAIPSSVTVSPCRWRQPAGFGISRFCRSVVQSASAFRQSTFMPAALTSAPKCLNCVREIAVNGCGVVDTSSLHHQPCVSRGMQMRTICCSCGRRWRGGWLEPHAEPLVNRIRISDLPPSEHPAAVYAPGAGHQSRAPVARESRRHRNLQPQIRSISRRLHYRR